MVGAMNLLFVSHTAVGGSYVVGSHHLARVLAARGHKVAHVSPPVTFAHRLGQRSSEEGFRIERSKLPGEWINGVLDIVPTGLVPWKAARYFGGSGRALFVRQFSGMLRDVLKSQGFSSIDVAIVDEPRLFPLAEVLSARTVIYRATDIYSQIRGDTLLDALEASIVRQVRRCIATSEPVRQHLLELGASDVSVIENGVDLNHFIMRVPKKNGVSRKATRKRAVYVGAIDKRFCCESVAASARRNLDVEHLIIGPFEEATISDLRQYRNVEIRGGIAFEAVPEILWDATVGILPLSKHPANNGRSPMKLYEYGAAGLPVVATATDELTRRAVPFVHLAHSEEDFAEQVGRLASLDTNPVDSVAVASAHGWDAKADALLEIVGAG